MRFTIAVFLAAGAKARGQHAAVLDADESHVTMEILYASDTVCQFAACIEADSADTAVSINQTGQDGWGDTFAVDASVIPRTRCMIATGRNNACIWFHGGGNINLGILNLVRVRRKTDILHDTSI